MTLTTAQLQTLKAWVIANRNSLFDQATADILNGPASPDYWCWRTSVEKKEVVDRPSQDNTTFTWAGNGFISRTAGEIECWNQLFNSDLTCHPNLSNVRQAFADIFSGVGNAQLNRAHLLAVSRRKATVAEKLFAVEATGPGNTIAQARGSTLNPDNFGVEGAITVQHLIDSESA